MAGAPPRSRCLRVHCSLLHRLLLACATDWQVLCHHGRVHLLISAENSRLAGIAARTSPSLDAADHVRLSAAVDGPDRHRLPADVVLLIFAGTFCRDDLRPRSLSALSFFHLLLSARSRTLAPGVDFGRAGF